MWKQLRKIFSRLLVPAPSPLTIHSHICRHHHVNNIRNDNLYEVNQRLTQSLLDTERICAKSGGEDNDFVRRHRYLADQLQELIALRQEVRDIHQFLDKISDHNNEI